MRSVVRLHPAQADEIVEVLCDAFHDYPVMRYMLNTPEDYDRRLTSLIGFFVAARAEREGVLLGRLSDDGELAGVATVTPRVQGPATPELHRIREATWEFLGPGAEARYEALGVAWEEVSVDAPQVHLNMIGVRAAHVGHGYGGDLLREVHRLAEEDTFATGISLTTESARNVPLYEKFGYEVVGTRSVPPDLQTWGFFLPLPSAQGGSAPAPPDPSPSVES